MECPHCKEECHRESCDVGVGVIYGPWGCPECGWSENPLYDSREGVQRDAGDRVFDQYGVSYSVYRPDGLAVLAGINVVERGKKA